MSEFREATAAVDALDAHLALLQTPTRWEHEDPETTLQSVRDAVTGATDVLLDKFRARCSMVDPVTGEPRFGPKMLVRVQELLERYDAVKAAVGETSELVAQVEQHAAARRQEALERQQREEQEQLRVREAEAARLRAIEAERARIEAEAQAQQALEQAREQERIATLARLAQQKRDERARAQQEEARRAQEAAERRAQAAAAFPVGRVGLERAIALLRESTGSPAALKQALTKLHAIAAAICAAPENAAIRRIPKRNAHFVADLGQFRGGYECLQALGFAEVEEKTSGDSGGDSADNDESLTVVYVLEEPDLSVDLDAWSDWFDNLKDMSAFIASALAQH